MVIPRVGMEMVVEFLDGDPDKPLVTGCVYNGSNLPPMDLPAKRTRSTFKTSSVGGKGFNELTFEDQSGEEFIYLHAQKNLDMHVENSSQRRVDFDDAVSVGNNSRGILLQSDATIRELRAHLRRFTMLWTPADDHAPVYFRFYDPRVVVDMAQALEPWKLGRFLVTVALPPARRRSLAVEN